MIVFFNLLYIFIIKLHKIANFCFLMIEYYPFHILMIIYVFKQCELKACLALQRTLWVLTSTNSNGKF